MRRFFLYLILSGFIISDIHAVSINDIIINRPSGKPTDPPRPTSPPDNDNDHDHDNNQCPPRNPVSPLVTPCLLRTSAIVQNCTQSSPPSRNLTAYYNCLAKAFIDCAVSTHQSQNPNSNDNSIKAALPDFLDQLQPAFKRWLTARTSYNSSNNGPTHATNGGVDPSKINSNKPPPPLQIQTLINGVPTNIPINQADGSVKTTNPDGSTSTASFQSASPTQGLGEEGTYDQTTNTIVPLDATDRPAWNRFDWRNINGKSYVNTVEDQGGCGSCWDFAGTSNFESQIALHYGLYSVPDDVNPGVTQTFTAPLYGGAKSGGIYLPTDISEQHVLDYAGGDCWGGGDDQPIKDVFMNPDLGGVPRSLETYPKCMNYTLGFAYAAPTQAGDHGFAGTWQAGATAGTPGGYCSACVISSNNNFASFGYWSGGSCHATNPINQCLPTRNTFRTQNTLSCRFRLKYTDPVNQLFTAQVVQDSNVNAPGSSFPEVYKPAYNPIASNYWGQSPSSGKSTLTEAQIKSALTSQGPLGVNLYAASASFQGYHSGVFDDPNCQYGVDPTDTKTYGKDLGTDHVVNLVGYGTQEVNQCLVLKTQTIQFCFPIIGCLTFTIPLPECQTYGLAPMDYWVIKNSWSQGWGEGGYVKMRAGVNVCNIEKYIFQAVVPQLDITWDDSWWIPIPVIKPWDPCFNSQKYTTFGSLKSYFPQLKCYDWLCDGNAQSPSLSTWNEKTSTWNPVNPDPSYNPSPLNPDYKQTETSGQSPVGSHSSILKNGYCANHLSQFCSLGKQYCSAKSGSWSNSPEDQTRIVADLFALLFGLDPVGPSSSEQTCAYYRWKCLPHHIIFPINIIDIVNVAGVSLDPPVSQCIQKQITALTPTTAPTQAPPRLTVATVPTPTPAAPLTLDRSDVFKYISSDQTCTPQPASNQEPATLTIDQLHQITQSCMGQTTTAPTTAPAATTSPPTTIIIP